MKKILISTSLLILVGVSSWMYFTYFNKNIEKKYTSRHALNHSSIKGINGAMQWLNERRANPETGIVNPEDVYKAMNQANTLRNNQKKGKASTLGIKWKELGPDNVGGRTRGLLVDKDDHNLMFAGSVGGGIFVSYTGGTAWKQVSDTLQNLSIACISQAINGDLYAGTGEAALASASGTASSGVIGAGIYKSTDRGKTWKLLESTSPFNLSYNNYTEWTGVYRIACHPTDANILYASTEGGLKFSKDAGVSWKNTYGTPTGTSTDVKIGSDGIVICETSGGLYKKLSTDTLFQKRSGIGGFPSSGAVGRTELAIAPSNPAYMYAACANGSGFLYNIYQSTDSGENWTVIGAGGAPEEFYPFSYKSSIAQGWYDNVIAVHPTNPEVVFVGGISFWRWIKGQGWSRLNSLFQSPTNQYYVHADNHVIAFNPSNPNTMFIGNDGGMYRTFNCLNEQPIFTPLNKGYNVTQFYSVAAGLNGSRVIGGTQDNGTNLIDSTGNTAMSATEVQGGDGGYCEISQINPEAFFAGQPGEISRSSTAGAGFSGFLDFNTGDLSGQFVTAFYLWESFNDQMSQDYVRFKADTSYISGDLIYVTGKNQYTFSHELESSLNKGDTLMVKDIVQAKYFVTLGSDLWMTLDPLVFSKIPEWYKIATGISSSSFAVSADGNTVFVGTGGGTLYRVSDIQTATYTYSASNPSMVTGITKKTINTFTGAVTGLALHPDDENKLVVCVGNYGMTNHVHYSKNAMSNTPVFTSIQGNLPSMPVYNGVFFTNPNDDKKYIVIGTELGMYSTDMDPENGTPTWYEENDGFPRVATFSVKLYKYLPLPEQSWGGYRIFAGTHGRGFFKTESFTTGMEDFTNKNSANKSSIVKKIDVYPNPVTSDFVKIKYELQKSDEIIINIYNLAGQNIESIKLGKQIAGVNEYLISTSHLVNGTYIITALSGNNELSTGKMILIK